MIKKLLPLLISTCCCLFAGAAPRQGAVMGVTGVVAVYDIYDDDGAVWARALMETTGERAASRFLCGEEFEKPLSESIYIDYAAMKYYSSWVMDGDTVTLADKFRYIGPDKGADKGAGGSASDSELGFQNIAGWMSKMVEFKSDGDVYQIWYTDNLGSKGTPWPELGVPRGVVTKIMRSGKVVAVATRITQKSTDNEIFPPSWGKQIRIPKYERLQNTKKRPYIFKPPVI